MILRMRERKLEKRQIENTKKISNNFLKKNIGLISLILIKYI